MVLGLSALLLSACSTRESVDFNADVRPILNDKCVSCHGGVRRRADLSLLFREDALRPAESGKPAIVPGNPDASELIRRVIDHDPEDRMPKEDDPLTEEEIGHLRQWIRDGAEWAPHWAYVAPTMPSVPRPAADGRSVIDSFVRARLEESGLTPSPEAECGVLVRRVTLDLIGLPPQPESVRAVCESESTYEEYVDELLASPRFGERWAAMWLDLARYADTQGYEKDGPRSIWRYRDYVIQAFNDDLPFDQFTIEQLAGDLLPDATVEQRLATAFHRNTMTNTEGGTDDEEHRVAAVIDRVNTTFEVWQGMSASCAQCHGHPFDPLRHEEYFQLFAFFNNTEDWDQDGDGPVEREFALQDRAEAERILAALDGVASRMDSLAETPELLAAHQTWETQLDDPAVVGAVRNTWQNELLRIVKIDESDRSDAQQAYSRKMFVETRPEFEAFRQERRELGQARAGLEQTTTPVLQALPDGRRRRTHVFERGNFLLPAAEVEPDTPAFLPPIQRDDTSRALNRLDLAEWLVSDENPLTARVMVNRFWEQLFGLGLVETLEDFGTEGAAPVHPELLDWLAISFREELNWSIKSLLKTVVLSSTYRQSSRVTPELLDADPRNTLLARGPRFRLSAEQIRDQALSVSGLLSETMFGPSVMPPQPDGIWQNPYSNMRWETAEGDERHRRALYTYWRRTAPYPSMITFDSPSREFCVSRRVRTNTPLQALVTLNDPVYVEAAEALAGRMQEAAATTREQIAAGYELAMGYPPVPAKLDAFVSLFEDVGGGGHADALVVVANAIMNTDEFLSKE